MHGGLHFLAAITLFFIAFPVAGRAFRRRYRGLRAFSLYSGFTGIASPVLFIVTVISGPLLGLSERVVIGIDLLYLTVLAALLAQGRLGSAPTSTADL